MFDEESRAALENIASALDTANRLTMDQNETLRSIARSLATIVEEGIPERIDKTPF